MTILEKVPGYYITDIIPCNCGEQIKKEIKTMNYKAFQVLAINQVTGEFILNTTLTAKTEREAEFKALKRGNILTQIEEAELNDVIIQVKAL